MDVLIITPFRWERQATTVLHTYREDIKRIEPLIHTEKLDGENNCLNQFGIFARSHAALLYRLGKPY